MNSTLLKKTKNPKYVRLIIHERIPTVLEVDLWVLIKKLTLFLIEVTNYNEANQFNCQ